MLCAIRMQECPVSRASRTKRSTPWVLRHPGLSCGRLVGMIRSLSKCIARAIATALTLAASPTGAAIGVSGIAFRDTDAPAARATGPSAHWSSRFRNRAPAAARARKQVARDRRAGAPARCPIDRLDPEPDRVLGAAQADPLAANRISPLVTGTAPDKTLISVDFRHHCPPAIRRSRRAAAKSTPLSASTRHA